MSEKVSSFIRVDDLMPTVSIEQVAAFYGVELPELHRMGRQIRSRCFLACGRTGETGDRVLAIDADHPAKQWKCHQYDCGKGGNLISICDLLKPGTNMGGRPRGDRFKSIAADLKAIFEGATHADTSSRCQPARPPPADEPKINLPLKDSPNERARQLTELDRKFVVDPAAMNPTASAYFRRRPWFTPDICRQWRMGYLPNDSGGDKSGGTMRGRIVYPWLSESGEVLTWFGRDPEYEDKHRLWAAKRTVAAESTVAEPAHSHVELDREPEKFHFVKGFHRGLELWGQHVPHQPGVADKLRELGLGLILVEGPNDVIRLATHDVPAVALCSNRISREQAEKVARLACDLAGGIITLLLDLDPEGEEGMRQCLWELGQLVPVRLAWTSEVLNGKFKGRQPESLTVEEWNAIVDRRDHGSDRQRDQAVVV